MDDGEPEEDDQIKSDEKAQMESAPVGECHAVLCLSPARMKEIGRSEETKAPPPPLLCFDSSSLRRFRYASNGAAVEKQPSPLSFQLVIKSE